MEKSSCYIILIFVISFFGCPPALDARGCRPVPPPFCTPLLIRTLNETKPAGILKTNPESNKKNKSKMRKFTQNHFNFRFAVN